MPRAKKVKKDWRNHPAKALLYCDIRKGELKDDVSAAAVFEKYRSLPEFTDISFDKFPDRLKRLRKKHAEKECMAVRDAAALEHDRQIHPMPAFDRRGYKRWPGSNARQFLLCDIDLGVLEEMKPQELHRSRPEYLEYDLKTFRKKIYQELKSEKFQNYIKDKRDGILNDYLNIEQDDNEHES